MNKRTKGLLAGAAGAALLLGGGTFALWSDSAEIGGGQITAGNLAVSAGEFVWKDISEDRSDLPHEIDDVTEFRIIPGDVIQGTAEVKIALEGENMVAQLGVNYSTDALTDATLLKEGSVSMAVFDGDDVILDDATSEPVYIGSHDNGNPDDLPELRVGADGTATYDVRITVEFDDVKDGNDLELAESVVNLSDVGISLDQVREGAPGYTG